MPKLSELNLVTIESKILSDVLNNSEVLDELSSKLEPSDFLNEDLRRIYYVALELYKDGKTVDPQTVNNYFDNHKELHFPDYHDIIYSLYNQFSSSTDTNEYANLIKNASIKRRLDSFSNKLQQTDFDTIKFDEGILDLQKEFIEIASSKKNIKLRNMQDITNAYSDRIEHILSYDSNDLGIHSGFANIDKIIGGFHPGDLFILAARPGVGKTSLALNFALNAAKEIKERQKTNPKSDKEKVVIFSLEMGAEQLCQKMLSIDAMIDVSPNNIKKTIESNFHSFNNSISNLSNLPILIDDSSDISILDIQSQLKQISNTCTIKLVIVDYIQLLKSKNNYQQNRQQEVAYISRTLKVIARALNVPIIGIAQLSREVEKDKRAPRLSDLRESGSIEQDADIVSFIYEEIKDQEDLEQPKDNTQQSDGRLVRFNIAKHRNGNTDTVSLIFHNKFGLFTELPNLNKNESQSN